jgi:hypothetical protein
MDSLTSGDLMVDFKSSFWGHEHYGTRLAANVDLVTQYPSAGVVINVIYPSNQVTLNLSFISTDFSLNFVLFSLVSVPMAQ